MSETKNPIIAKYFGKAPENVQELARSVSTKEPVIKDSEKGITAEFELTNDVLPKGLTKATIRKVYEFEETLRGVVAGGTARLVEDHPGKKVHVKVKVGDILSVDGSVLKSGKVATRVKVEKTEAMEDYFDCVDTFVKEKIKSLEAK